MRLGDATKRSEPSHSRILAKYRVAITSTDGRWAGADEGDARGIPHARSTGLHDKTNSSIIIGNTSMTIPSGWA
jgi:hypothetical protein